jgi:hypothetical protein
MKDYKWDKIFKPLIEKYKPKKVEKDKVVVYTDKLGII